MTEDWRPPLNHVVHPYTPTPTPGRELCICGLWHTHHLHVGVSSADCTCMECTERREGAIAAWGLTLPTLQDRLGDALNAAPHFTTREVVATVMRVLTEPGGDLRERLRHALHAYDTDIDARAVDNLVPVVEAETARAEQRYTALAELHVNVCTYGVELQKRAEKAEQERDSLLNAMPRLDMHMALFDPDTGSCVDWCPKCLHERVQQAERERDEALEALTYGAETLRRAEKTEATLQRAREAFDGTIHGGPHPKLDALLGRALDGHATARDAENLARVTAEFRRRLSKVFAALGMADPRAQAPGNPTAAAVRQTREIAERIRGDLAQADEAANPEHVWYGHVSLDDVRALVNTTLDQPETR